VGGTCPTCRLTGATSYHWTQLDNIKRDPFEIAVGDDQKTALSLGGSLDTPATAYIYDWNLLPIGQLLWLKELTSYVKYPPLQDPASYNLDQVLQEVKKEHAKNALD